MHTVFKKKNHIYFLQKKWFSVSKTHTHMQRLFGVRIPTFYLKIQHFIFRPLSNIQDLTTRYTCTHMLEIQLIPKTRFLMFYKEINSIYKIKQDWLYMETDTSKTNFNNCTNNMTFHKITNITDKINAIQFRWLIDK